ncbi:ATP-binding protein [Burkholderia sp. PAMC 26561]|uniref:ATP-binding protein n=1 Tax=Burkholderia sp. PAMC 26561 TaxID=1795043 RepID=UPI00076B6936|nr:ATP-binding protein [Burkholderia sp. PAMC 26561]AME26968.1 adenine nucleotide alpha hydrolase [Burkholderia sp. PAMC 26561]AME27887.1 adenine nucleotide alpha hydrolase [Burkholderia sp. PAMC 26561]
MFAALIQILDSLGDIAVAVSGGVDSMTLSCVAHRAGKRNGATVRMLHASSPAVPAEATERVRHVAAVEGWSLSVIDANEFGNAHYRENPVNRCFFCKSQLYSTIQAQTNVQIVSGANTDDLGEYRPGLDAARERDVRHPYIEAGIDKAGVRRIAREMGLESIADLPSSPCLSSRIETGIRIEAPSLEFVHRVEKLVAAALTAATVRCRVRALSVVIELDDQSLAALTPSITAHLIAAIKAEGEATGRPLMGSPPYFAPYKVGSAFLTRQA